MSLVVDIEKKLGSFLLRSKFETGSGTMALLGRLRQERDAQVHRRDHDPR